MNLRSPLGRALGLGSAKTGATHWWRQRLSALALVPLGLWFAVSLALGSPHDYAAAVAWLSVPLNTLLCMLFVLTLFYHSELGVQVVIEDYVHGAGVKLAVLILSKFVHAGLALAGTYAILRVALRAGALTGGEVAG